MRHPVCHLETEEEYFRRLDAELIEDMRQHDAFEERRQRMATACQTEDPRILSTLERLGYHPATAALLYFVPLVHVAWVDGWISPAERNRILVMASLEGIRENVPAYQQLTAWLDRRPAEEFFEGTRDAIQWILESLPETERNARAESLIRRCREVAFASCGLFGWKSRICMVKRSLIREMAKRWELKPRAAAARASR